MPEATFHFPPGFLWGTATASHQVEGNNTNNDWWAWEQEEGRIKEDHRSGLACNWWERAEEDFDRAAELGQNSHRLSVEWSRIEPEEGRFDNSALHRYRQMLRALRERGMEPMVTLHHFSLPLWLSEMGGWEAPRILSLFDRYVARVMEALGDFCDLWCTINEPNVVAALGYLEGIFPPGKQDLRTALQVGRTLLQAHGAAYRRIHLSQPAARVGLAHNMRIFDPRNPRSVLDRQVAAWQDRFFNQSILSALGQRRGLFALVPGWRRKLRNTLDWIGLNYYTRDVVKFDRKRPDHLFGLNSQSEGAELMDGGYGEVYPEGISRCLRRLGRMGLPIYITEHGLPDQDDDQRPRVILLHLHQVWRMIQSCFPVMGYYHWTLVDNFEWAEGWTMRFGLIEVDPQTQERNIRGSAYLYRDICRANAITPQIVDEHLPELRPELLPG